MNLPGMVHGAIRLADHPRANVLASTRPGARAHPGVVAVLTADDVPGERVQGASTRTGRRSSPSVRPPVIGDVPAVVAARDQGGWPARRRPYRGRLRGARAADRPCGAQSRRRAAAARARAGNVLSVTELHRGDVDAALAGAAHVLTETFQTQFIEHAFLEPESALAVPGGDGGVHCYSQGQGIWDDRRQIAELLGLPRGQGQGRPVTDRRRVRRQGGPDVQAHVALLACGPGGPQAARSPRAKPSLPSQAPSDDLDYTVGCDADGHLLGLRARIIGDTGAYASVGDKVLERAAGHACGVYRVPARRHRCAGRLHQQSALRRHARVRREPGQLRAWRACSTGSPSGSASTAGSSAGATRSTSATSSAPASGSARASACSRPCSRSGTRTARARYAGIGCGVKNVGIGNGAHRVRQRDPAPRARRHSHALPRLDRDGAGGAHGAAPDVCEELGLAPGAVRVARRHRPRARARPDDRFARDGARRPARCSPRPPS